MILSNRLIKTSMTSPAVVRASNAESATEKRLKTLKEFVEGKEASLHKLNTTYSGYKLAGLFESDHPRLEENIRQMETNLVGLQGTLDELFSAQINGA
jgi:hypothetical protein